MERCLKEKNWGLMRVVMRPACGSRTATGARPKEIAAICSDTWGVEVRPNETTEVNQPGIGWSFRPLGLTMGEMFYVKELAEDCEADAIYEFFFCGSPLIITGGPDRQSIRRRSNNRLVTR